MWRFPIPLETVKKKSGETDGCVSTSRQAAAALGSGSRQAKLRQEHEANTEPCYSEPTLMVKLVSQAVSGSVQ